MGAPPGHPPYNIYGEGGAPREYDREALADDLLTWVDDYDNWTIKKWRIKHKIPPWVVDRMKLDSERFRYAYAYAMDVIAQRREEMNHVDEMKDSLYKQHLHVYDKDRVAQDDETADKQCAREAKAKADSLQPPIYANQQQLDQGHENMELKAQLAAALAIIKAKEINDNQS